MKKVLLIVSLAFLATAVFAQSADIITAGAKPGTVDGSIAKDEYTWTKSIGTVSISGSLGKDGLVYLAIQAPTSGWVALGFGSLRMDKAKIAIAYDDNGKPAFSAQLGMGHKHSDTKDTFIKSWSVKSTKDTTILEISVPKEFIVADSKIDLIWAYGAKKDFSSYHQKKGSLTIQIK